MKMRSRWEGTRKGLRSYRGIISPPTGSREGTRGGLCRRVRVEANVIEADMHCGQNHQTANEMCLDSEMEKERGRLIKYLKSLLKSMSSSVSPELQGDPKEIGPTGRDSSILCRNPPRSETMSFTMAAISCTSIPIRRIGVQGAPSDCSDKRTPS